MFVGRVRSQLQAGGEPAEGQFNPSTTALLKAYLANKSLNVSN